MNHDLNMSRRQLGRAGAAALLGASGSQWSMAQENNKVETKKTVNLPDGSRAPALGMGSWRLAAGRRPLVQELEARVAFFACMDLLVNTCTLALQLFAASRLMWRRNNTGVMLTLCLLPLVSVATFGALALWPILAALVAAQALRRIANFAFAKPARELFFTRAAREDRYKAKNFMDTVVYRSGDQAGSWAWAGMTALGLTLALWLGRMWQRAARTPTQSK